MARPPRRKQKTPFSPIQGENSPFGLGKHAGVCWGRNAVNRVKRRLLLVMAALSPGVVTLTLHEFAVSLAFMVLGLFGAISIAAATIAVFPQIGPVTLPNGPAKKAYPSLVLSSALGTLRDMSPDPISVRLALQARMTATSPSPGFVTEEEQIIMVLSQILARWDAAELSQLEDDQLRELWLVDRLMRASPAEAGALSRFFASPNAMLAMRDVLATPTTV